MKLSLALASTLLAATASAYLEQNTLCGDNKACEGNCQDGRYHIVTDDANSIHFGCSLKPNVPPPTYANPDCHFGLGDGPEETSKSQATCDTVGGTLCRSTFKLEPKFVNYCVMLNKDVAAFKENCETAEGAVKEHNNDFGSYEILVDDCE
jgi:hypothetical protein